MKTSSALESRNSGSTLIWVSDQRNGRNQLNNQSNSSISSHAIFIRADWLPLLVQAKYKQENTINRGIF